MAHYGRGIITIILNQFLTRNHDDSLSCCIAFIYGSLHFFLRFIAIYYNELIYHLLTLVPSIQLVALSGSQGNGHQAGGLEQANGSKRNNIVHVCDNNLGEFHQETGGQRTRARSCAVEAGIAVGLGGGGVGMVSAGELRTDGLGSELHLIACHAGVDAQAGIGLLGPLQAEGAVGILSRCGFPILRQGGGGLGLECKASLGIEFHIGSIHQLHAHGQVFGPSFIGAHGPSGVTEAQAGFLFQHRIHAVRVTGVYFRKAHIALVG